MLPPVETMNALALEVRNSERFAVDAKQLWAMARGQAREQYKAAQARLKAEGKWPKQKVKPVDDNQLTLGMRDGAATATAQVVPAQADAPAPVVEAETTSTPAAEKKALTLEKIHEEATKIAEEDSIKAIRYIRDETGFDLLAAKLWVDAIENPELAKDPPLVLQVAKNEYMKRQIAHGAPSLNEQVQMLRDGEIAKTMDADKGKAEGQFKIDLAGDNQSMMVQAARRIARELSEHGPITIDDVTANMAKSYNVLPARDGKKAHKWKGSVFTKTEWVFIGETPSRQVEAHGRPVGVWALKTWLKNNTLNGKDTHVSSYVVSKLYGDFKRVHPQVQLPECNCLVGEERLSEEIRDTIVKSKNRLYEVPVSFVPGAVGAMIMLPNTDRFIKQT